MRRIFEKVRGKKNNKRNLGNFSKSLQKKSTQMDENLPFILGLGDSV